MTRSQVIGISLAVAIGMVHGAFAALGDLVKRALELDT